MVSTEGYKEETESDKTEKPPETTHEDRKDIIGFTNIIVHHIDVDDVVDVGFCQVGTDTDVFTMDEKDDATTSVVDDNRMKTGMIFLDIVRGNQPSCEG